MNPVIKHIYLTSLIAGVFLVGVGQMIVIIRVANGRSSGDGFYRTTYHEREAIRAAENDVASQRDGDVPLNVETGNVAERDAEEHAAAPESIRVDRDRVVAVAANNATRTISRQSETIDVTLAGSNNSVTIASGTQLRRLGIAGKSNTVTFEEATDVSRISVSGMDNVIIVPNGIDFEVFDSGLRTRIDRPIAAGQ